MPLDNRQLLRLRGLRDLLILDLAVERGLLQSELGAEIVLVNLVRDPGTPSRVLEHLRALAGIDARQLMELEAEADRQISEAEASPLGALRERGGVIREFRDAVERARAEGCPAPDAPKPTARRAVRVIHSGRYQVTDLIARGGQGLIYEAIDTDLGRSVALKFLRPDGLESDFDDPFSISPAAVGAQAVQLGAASRAFLEEPRRMSALAHPGILTVHEHGQTLLGLPLYVMPLVHGETIADGLKAGTISAGDGLEVLLRAAEAVAYAHKDHALVHCDLNPENLMRSEFDEVFVLDWGAAQYVGTPLDAPATLATVGYAAPEVLQGTGVLTPAVDVFALGVMLHELLTREHPFPGKTPEAYTESLQAHSPFKPVASVPAADDRLIRLCVRCLALEPGKRPRDAGAFADILRSALRGRRRA